MVGRVSNDESLDAPDDGQPPRKREVRGSFARKSRKML